MGRSLKEQIEELSKPVNPDFDIEDNERNPFDESSDEETVSGKIKNTDHYVGSGKSKLRDDGIKVGKKYSGSKTSRAEIFGSGRELNGVSDSEDEASDSLVSDSEGSDSEIGDSDSNGQVSDSDNDSVSDRVEEDIESDQMDDNSEDIADNDSEDHDSAGSDSADNNSENEDDTYKREKLKKLMQSERKHIVSRLSTSTKTDAIKGYAILHQQQLFEKILDSRIKFQKLVTSSNQLPLTKETFDETNVSKDSIKTLKSSLYDLMDKIFEIRNELFVKDKIKQDTVSRPRKRTYDQYLETTSEFDEHLNRYRDNALLKWSNKINSASGTSLLNSAKFKNLNQDSLRQVQNNLLDMDKLIKRTQLNRKKVVPIGGLILDLDQEDRSLQYSSYIFDDEDFYRVLLNDLIDKKLSSNEKLSSNLTINKAPIKLHKNYERKASKGRKLNYQIQENLSNFETPKQFVKWNDDQIDEFFAGLLGQKINMAESEEEEEEEDEDVPDTGLRVFG